jgi:hypothetical protein
VPPGQCYDDGLIISDDEDSVLPLKALSDISSPLAGSAEAPIPVPLQSLTPASAATCALIADSLATTLPSTEGAVLHEQVLWVDCIHCEQVATMVHGLVEKATATHQGFLEIWIEPSSVCECYLSGLQIRTPDMEMQ